MKFDAERINTDGEVAFEIVVPIGSHANESEKYS